jgi:acetyl esterase/lipase
VLTDRWLFGPGPQGGVENLDAEANFPPLPRAAAAGERAMSTTKREVTTRQPDRRTSHHRLVRAARIAGGILAFTSLALGSAQFYRVSSATLGPGAFMLSIPKILGGSLAPLLALAGAAGAVLALSSLWLGRGQVPLKRGIVAPLIVLAGLAAATVNVVYTQQVIASSANFAQAFGADWQEQIPAELEARMLADRGAWFLSVAPGAHVERDLVFATVPGTDRALLADLWGPPDGVAPSGLGFIYLHGGGYSAFDKGGPTELWFRHLAAQGHVVMDVAYRLIPETDVPGMQADVKRAIGWLKRDGVRYGVNPDNIVLAGGSAGSHLALLAAYAPYHPLFTPEDVRGMDLSVRGVIGYYNAGDYRLESQPVVHPAAWQRTAAGLLTSLLERWSASEIAVDDTGGWDARLFLGGSRTSGRSAIGRSRPSFTSAPKRRRRCSSWANTMCTSRQAGRCRRCTAGCERAASPRCTWSSRGPIMRSTCFCRRFRPRPTPRCTRWTASWR